MNSPSPDDSSSPSPTQPSSPSPELTLPPTPSPLFRPTSPPPDDTPTDPWLPSLDGPPSLDDPAGDLGSDHPSTGKATRAKLRGLKASIKGALETAGGLAHQLLTREHSPERQIGLYLPDDDDVRAIGDPLASIASRRAPESVANPDVTDLIGVVIGVAGYLLKQKAKMSTLARERFLEGTVQDPDAEQPEPADA